MIAVLPLRIGVTFAVAATVLLSGGVAPAGAVQPALDRARAAGPLTVYPDAEVGGRFYYTPGPLELATRADGRPAVLFLVTRYTGTRVTGDQGESSLFAHFSFDIEQKGVRADALDAARRSLAADGVSRPDLRLLPIRRTEVQVVFAPLGGGAADTLRSGDFENRAASAGTLSERRFTLRLDPHTAEALWRMLESERTLVSFSYAYVAEGVTESGGELVVEGSLDDEVTPPGPDLVAAEPNAGLRAVRADAFRLTLDPERDADLIQLVDVNAERALQPAHGVLDVRCYDFRNALRPDLVMKMIELEGEAANGRTARHLVIFKASEPDEAVHRVRFPFAIRLDEPLRFRVREIATNGEQVDLGWQERSWIGVLDVTTPLDRLDGSQAAADARLTPEPETDQ